MTVRLFESACDDGEIGCFDKVAASIAVKLADWVALGEPVVTSIAPIAKFNNAVTLIAMSALRGAFGSVLSYHFVFSFV